MKQTWALASLYLATFMALLDVSVVVIAQTAITEDLRTTFAGAQWVIDAYTVALASTMLSCGALADRWGRKRVFLIGLAVFTGASVACAMAPGAAWLIAARAVQGVGASVLAPGALSLIVHAFPEPGARARVIGTWSTVISLAFLLGPVLGGPLTDLFGWRSVFLINLPLGGLALALGARFLTESADPDGSSPDPLGQVLAIAWISSLAYALIEVSSVALGVAAVTLALFIVVELRQPRPMFPIRLLGERGFGLVNLASFMTGFAAFGSFFLLSAYLQSTRGASPTEAGLQLLPYVLGGTVGSTVAGRLVQSLGAKPPLLAGQALIAASLLALSTVDTETPYPYVAVLFAGLGLGVSTSGVPSNALAVGLVPPRQSGIASATVTATRQTGTAVGVALLGLIATAGPKLADGLPHALLTAGVSTVVVTVLLLSLKASC
ncbi:MFS transporter [Allokutzneria multivorans]|uniref:MFS transporter n=1 Tax=Allokutzneria multivorans TaxID=1142134 RepID=A0ABP7TCX3_9PSEU